MDACQRNVGTPLLKDDGMNTDFFSKYRPVSNQNAISKIVQSVAYSARLAALVKQTVAQLQQISMGWQTLT